MNNLRPHYALMDTVCVNTLNSPQDSTTEGLEKTNPIRAVDPYSLTSTES